MNDRRKVAQPFDNSDRLGGVRRQRRPVAVDPDSAHARHSRSVQVVFGRIADEDRFMGRNCQGAQRNLEDLRVWLGAADFF